MTGSPAPDLEFRLWKAGDDLELLQLWGDPEGPAHEQFRAAFGLSADSQGSGGQPWRRCLVATDQGIPVAAAVVYESVLHPGRLWAFVEVAKDHRRQGIGAVLLGMLRHEAEAAPSGVTALRTKVDQGGSGEAFALAAGLAPVQKSRLVQVAAGSFELPQWPEDDQESIQDLATGSVALTEAVAEYYRFIYAWDPVGELSLGLTQRMFLDEASGAHGAVVLRARGHGATGPIRAFAVSYGPREDGSDDPAAEVFLGHDPSLPEELAQRDIRDLLAVIAHQHPVVMELDESMQALNGLVAPLLASGEAAVLGPATVILAE